MNVSIWSTREEAEEYVNIGTINGLFVLGRSMGFIGESVSYLLCVYFSLYFLFVIYWFCKYHGLLR